MARVISMTKKGEYDPNKVEQPTPDYEFHMSLLHLPHTLMKGTRGMKEAEKLYLPKEEAESPEQYKTRLARSFLLNVFKKTVMKLSGEVFSKPVVLPEDMEDDIKVWSSDIDLSGHNITAFGKELFEAGVVDGVVHILVDMPQIETRINESNVTEYLYTPEDGDPVWKPLTLEEMRKNDWRPYFVQIKASQLIGARTTKVDGQSELTQIRILEVTEEPDGEYGVKEVKRIRVIEPRRYEVYILTKDEKGRERWLLEKEGITAFNRVPLVTWLVGDPISQTTAWPPLDDLAQLNLAHWQSSSDQKNILHYARLITYFGKLLDIDDKKPKTKAVIGANMLVHGKDENSDMKVVEHSGAAIEAGRNDLKDLEAQMRLFGMSLVIGERTGNVTATEKAIDTAETDSSLKSWAISLGEVLNKAYEIAVESMSLEESSLGEGVKVNTDFKNFLQSLEVRELRESYIDGILPKQIVIEEYQRRGIISSELDFVEIENMIKRERNDEGN